LIGEKNPLWKGGHSGDRGPNWDRQRREARKRDGYRCQCCGIKQKKKKAHAVHHIVPFREFGYIRGINHNYVQANELSNLITLCASCHNKAESGLVPLQIPLINW
jgi:DEAD/DEAH box helicase domain-containing protein